MSQPPPRLDDLRIERSARPDTSRRGAPWVIIGIILVAIVAAVLWFRRPQPLLVRTTAARELTGTPTDRTVLNASGYVTARRESTISSKIMGKVLEVLVEEGVRVKEGQVLARLDATNLDASLQLAKAQFHAADAALRETEVRIKEAELDLQRQSALNKTNASARAEFDRADAAVQAWRARLAQQQSERVVAERGVAVWQQQIDDTIIRAPFAGVVTSKNAQPGEMISPMASGGFTRTGICTIVDMESLEVEIDVNESYLNRVSPGQQVEATLDAYPEWRIPCRVIAIIPTADRQKSTVKVRVGFDQLDPRILPQMAVKVGFRESGAAPARAAPRSVAVPKAALRHENERDVVFVVQNGRLERRAVTVARAQDSEVVLSAGVSPGEKVVIEARGSLTEGARAAENSL